jgi:hypothetical protein
MADGISTPTGTISYLGPPLNIADQEMVILAACINDMCGISVSIKLFGGFLETGDISGVASYTPAALSGLAWDYVGQWRRLAVAAPFLIALAGRLTDDHVEGMITAVGHADDPAAQRLRDGSHSEGGIARMLQGRIQGIENEFASQLDRATQVLRYAFQRQSDSTLPPPKDLGVATHTAAGCVVGGAMVVVGGYGVYATAGKLAATAGAAAPLAVLTGTLSSGLVVGGLSTMAAQCFS